MLLVSMVKYLCLGNRSEWDTCTLLLRMTHTMTSQNTKLSSWGPVYTGCPRRNVPDFRRMFLMLKYTDITQNTYVQS
jgi:hypothetical protein